MTNIFLKLESNWSLKLFKTPGLQKALQSPLRRNKSFINGFLKSVLHRMNRNTKIVKIFSKQLKRKQRKYTTPTKYLNVLEIYRKWNVMKDITGKSKVKSTNLPSKLTTNKVDVYNKPEIADSFNDLFTNIGQKLASQIHKSCKTFET